MWSLGGESSSDHVLHDLVVTHLPRVRSLRTWIERALWAQYFGAFKTRAPALESLTLGSDPDGFPLPPNLFDGQAPLLRHITLHGGLMPIQSPLLAQLETLHIVNTHMKFSHALGPPDKLLELLRSMTNLHRLHLEVHCWVAGYPPEIGKKMDVTNMAPVLLPHLVHLHLEEPERTIVFMVDHLVLPVVDDLLLICTEPTVESCAESILSSDLIQDYVARHVAAFGFGVVESGTERTGVHLGAYSFDQMPDKPNWRARHADSGFVLNFTLPDAGAVWARSTDIIWRVIGRLGVERFRFACDFIPPASGEIWHNAFAGMSHELFEAEVSSHHAQGFIEVLGHQTVDGDSEEEGTSFMFSNLADIRLVGLDLRPKFRVADCSLRNFLKRQLRRRAKAGLGEDLILTLKSSRGFHRNDAMDIERHGWAQEVLITDVTGGLAELERMHLRLSSPSDDEARSVLADDEELTAATSH
jgi:hypothetical protein